MKYFLTIWLAVVAFNCLIDATPLPEDRAKTPKEVQKINKWLGVDKNSDILKDILKVADAFIKIQENKQKIEDEVNIFTDKFDALSSEVGNNTGAIATNADSIEDNANAISDNADSISDNADDIAINADDIEDNADDIETLTTEVEANADNIWHNTGDIIANKGDISDNAAHINALKAIIEIHFPGESTVSPPTTFFPITGETVSSTTDTTTGHGHIHSTTTDQTTTEPTTTVQTTTDEPTTTVQTTTVQTTTVQTSTVVTSTVQSTTTSGSDCTIDGYEPDNNGNCYKVVKTKLNWAKALKACKADGNAILATVPDTDANTFIKAKLSGNSWIGGNDLTKEGNWKWINGDGWGFENWKNGNDINNKNEDCAYMASSNGKWQDDECTKKMHYVCMEK